MNAKKLFVPLLIGALATATIVVTFARADQAKDKPASAAGAPPQMQLPPGWTEDDMKTAMASCMPGKQHEFLAAGCGTWKGKATMWMFPGAEPATSECTSTVSKLLDGRYIKTEYTGEMPGAGPFNGFGLQGFDNVTQKFVNTWVDSFSTGIMTGAGELSADGKTLSYACTFNCPIKKGPLGLRQIETITGPDSRTLELIGTEPKSGKEYKMMFVEFTRAK